MDALEITSTLTLPNGVRIPRLGFGTYKAGPGEGTYRAVRWALETGYRHIDCAWFYGNEGEVAQALRDSGIPRDSVFITSKLWNDDHGQGTAQEACRRGLERMGLDRFDLYLIHWPVPGLWRETWKAMEELHASGSCRTIGVSNFTLEHMSELLTFAEVRPAVNQMELTPFVQHRELVDFCQGNGIAIECFSPLSRGMKFDDPTIRGIASAHDRSPAQILIRWGLQKGYVTLPKSSTRERIMENADVFGFDLAETEMAALDALDCGFSVMKPEWVAQFEYDGRKPE